MLPKLCQCQRCRDGRATSPPGLSSGPASPTAAGSVGSLRSCRDSFPSRLSRLSGRLHRSHPIVLCDSLSFLFSKCNLLSFEVCPTTAPGDVTFQVLPSLLVHAHTHLRPGWRGCSSLVGRTSSRGLRRQVALLFWLGYILLTCGNHSLFASGFVF